MTLPFTIEELEQAIEDGWVTARVNENYPELTIFNYSENAQFSKHWTNVTLNCRGLILNNQTNRVVARPWGKFFNASELEAAYIEPSHPVEVMDKLDGSLGILYRIPPGSFRISTRGSFHSEQAEHASDLWAKKYAHLNDYARDSGLTFLFEIIFKSNRIVLDYGTMDDLVLLGAVDIEDGYYYGPNEAKAYLGWTGPVAETFDIKLKEIEDHLNRTNAEGYVVRQDDKLVKFKQEDYVQIHRLRFNMNPRRIWEALSEGKDLEEIVKPLPDEFQSVILEIGERIQDHYEIILGEIIQEWALVALITDRREFALSVKYFKHKSAMFTLFDKRSVDQYIWKLIKPRGDDV